MDKLCDEIERNVALKSGIYFSPVFFIRAARTKLLNDITVQSDSKYRSCKKNVLTAKRSSRTLQ